MLDLIPGVFEVSPVLNFGKRVEHKLAVEEHMIEKNLQFLRNQFSEQPSKDPLEPQYLSFQFNVETIALSENQLSTLNDFKRKLVSFIFRTFFGCKHFSKGGAFLRIVQNGSFKVVSWSQSFKITIGEILHETTL